LIAAASAFINRRVTWVVKLKNLCRELQAQ